MACGTCLKANKARRARQRREAFIFVLLAVVVVIGSLYALASLVQHFGRRPSRPQGSTAPPQPTSGRDDAFEQALADALSPPPASSSAPDSVLRNLADVQRLASF